MDWQHYSYAQISPFKSIEFEIFAKNLSFLMFKSYKSTIMQIWLTHDRGLTKRPSTIQKWLKLGVKNIGSRFRNNIFGVGWTFFILSAGGELPIMQGTQFPRYKTPTQAKNTILLLLGLVKLISIQRAFYWRVVFVYCLHHCFKDLQYFYIFFNCFPMSLINPVLQMHPAKVANKLKWHVNTSQGLVFSHFRIARARILSHPSLTDSINYWQLIPHNIPTQEHK